MNNPSKSASNNMFKTGGKYSKLVEAFRHYNIIRDNSQEKVTVKFNNGGILYIEVEDKRVLK